MMMVTKARRRYGVSELQLLASDQCRKDAADEKCDYVFLCFSSRNGPYNIVELPSIIQGIPGVCSIFLNPNDSGCLLVEHIRLHSS